MPTSVSGVTITAADDTSITVEWVPPSDIYGFTRIQVNDLHTNDTAFIGSFRIGVTNIVDIPALKPNTPYAITIT